MDDLKQRRWWLYILKLDDGKWYVGITSKTPKERFTEHLDGNRAAYWTIRHKPLEIELIEDLGIVSRKHAEQYENKVTRSLMKERGLNNVRGGDLTDTKEYTRRFGWVWIKSEWNILCILLLQFVLIIYLLIDKYILR